jgi:hypothetical protein
MYKNNQVVALFQVREIKKQLFEGSNRIIHQDSK